MTDVANQLCFEKLPGFTIERNSKPLVYKCPLMQTNGLWRRPIAEPAPAKQSCRKPGTRLATGRFGHLHTHAAGQEVVHEAVLLLAEFRN